MKHNNFIAGLTLMAVLLIQNESKSQTLVAPTLADNVWTPAAGTTGINTALIDIPLDNSTYRQLAACAYDGGGGGIVLRDFSSGFPALITYPAGSPYTMASIPDVILGNKQGSYTNFIMAVVFVNSINQVEIDYFDIYYYSATAYSVTFNSYQLLPVPMYDAPLGTVHIDVVAKSSMLIPYGLPFCDRFFVTYDAGGGTLNEISVTYGSLNAYNALIAGPRVINSGCLFAQDSWQPDVAGIERYIGSGPRDIACLTWVEGPNTAVLRNWALYYSEWDPSLTPCADVSAYTKLDGTPPNPAPNNPYFSYPRIDANDDYLTNGSGACQSKVVCQAFNNFPITGYTNDIGIYNYPLIGGTNSYWVDVSPLEYPIGSGSYPFPTGPYNHFAPAVAYGPNNGINDEFMVTECTNVPLFSPGDFFMMSPMDQPCGGGVSFNPGSTAHDYFDVNLNYPASSMNYANSVSTPCNNVRDTSLVAWTHNGQIWYKRSGMGLPNGYAYKTKPTTSTPISKNEGILSIFPNPANDHLSVSNPPGNSADRYCIKNMLGQEVTSGALLAGEQQLNISGLTAGNYLVSFYRDGAPFCNKIFVKE